MTKTDPYDQQHITATHYEIRLKGHLNEQWTPWFDGLTITLIDNGETLLAGPVIDQAELHGLLKKIRDLGLPLLLVKNLTIDEIDTEKTK
ncbi:MAG: hypothetical protein AAF629_09365 [Chloroflexota bacterium]